VNDVDTSLEIFEQAFNEEELDCESIFHDVDLHSHGGEVAWLFSCACPKCGDRITDSRRCKKFGDILLVWPYLRCTACTRVLPREEWVDYSLRRI
jgi:predicted RNA-binding Zn-ribbon protein involved in translation (DUF1610 family)